MVRFSDSDAQFQADVSAHLRGARDRRPNHRKAAVLFAIIALVYAGVVSGKLSGPLLACLMAFCQLLYLIVAMGIGHDASHRAFAQSARGNRIAGLVFDLVGINSWIWHYEHVISHHGTPNVTGHDVNLHGWGPLRLDPHSPLRWHHRYQHLYAWGLYSMASLYKVWIADFVGFVRAKSRPHLPDRPPRDAVVRLIVCKVFAVVVALFIPLWANTDTIAVLVGYVSGHLLAGLLMGAIFQPTHTNELVCWPVAHEDTVTGSYQAHILATTADFCVESRWITWLTGGLNIHAVHHLFPRLPHLQLRAAARIVREVAPKHDLQYRVFETWPQALASHYRALRALGRDGQPLVASQAGSGPSESLASRRDDSHHE